MYKKLWSASRLNIFTFILYLQKLKCFIKSELFMIKQYIIL